MMSSQTLEVVLGILGDEAGAQLGRGNIILLQGDSSFTDIKSANLFQGIRETIFSLCNAVTYKKML